jgi:hypothetical protein
VTFSPRAIRAGFGAAIVVSAILSPFAGAAQADPCPSSTSTTTGNESSVTLVIPEETATPAPSACPTASTPPDSTGGSGASGGSGGSGGSSSGTDTKGGVSTATSGSVAGAPATATAPESTSSSSDGSVQEAPRLTLDRTSVAPNQWILATGDSYTAAERVHFVFFPRAVDLGTFTADATGHITARFRIPADTRPGAHTVEATGVSSHYVRNAPITVVSAGFAGGLPYRWWIGIVVGAVLLGLLALVLYFRRSIAGWFAPSTPATGFVS